jgi:hypothetical protein
LKRKSSHVKIKAQRQKKIKTFEILISLEIFFELSFFKAKPNENATLHSITQNGKINNQTKGFLEVQERDTRPYQSNSLLLKL